MQLSIRLTAIFAISTFAFISLLSVSFAYAQDTRTTETTSAAAEPAPAPAPAPATAPVIAPASEPATAPVPGPVAPTPASYGESVPPPYEPRTYEPRTYEQPRPYEPARSPSTSFAPRLEPASYREIAPMAPRSPSNFGGGDGAFPEDRARYTEDWNPPPPPNMGWNSPPPSNDRGQEPRGSGGGGQGWEQGPDEGSFERDQERFLSDKKRMVRDIERGVKNMARSITRIKKQGASVPAEYETLIAELTSAIGTVKNATEVTDDVESAIAVLEERGEEIREMGPRLGMLEQLPRIIKDATKQVAMARKQLSKSVTRAKAAGIDVAEIAASIEGKLSGIETAIANARSSADPEEAMESLRENAFEATEDVRDEMMILENISNASKMLKDADREIKRLEKDSAALKRNRKNTTELNSLIAQIKTTVGEIRNAIKGQMDPEELFELFSEAERIHNDAIEEAARLRGEATDIDKKFKVPDASKTSALGAAVYAAYMNVVETLGL